MFLDYSNYCGLMAFDVSAYPNIQSIELYVYRNDETTNGARLRLSALPAAQHTSTTFVGEHLITRDITAHTGYKSVSIGGALLTAIIGYTGRFRIYLSSGSYINLHGGAGSGSRHPYLKVTYDPNIPTVPEPSETEAELGQQISIGLTPYIDTNTHVLTYKCGTVTGTISDPTAWTIPNTLLPTGDSGNCEIICTTYDADEVLIGTASAFITVTIPSTWQPTLTDATVEEGVSAIAALSLLTYVQGQSKLKITITPTASPNATVSALYLTVPGADESRLVASSPVSGQPVTFYSSVLMTAGTAVIATVRLVDSRGKQTFFMQSVSVTSYTKPQISNVTAERCDTDGTPSRIGEWLMLSVDGKAFALGNVNTLTAKYGFRVYGSSVDYTWFNITQGITGLAIALDRYETGKPVNQDVQYEIIVRLSDAIASTDYITVLGLGKVMVHFRADKDGIGFGDKASTPGFHVFMQPDFHGNKVSVADGGTGVGSVAEIKQMLGLGGSVIEETNSRSAASGTAVTGASFEATSSGLWLVTYKATFGSNNTGRRIMNLLDTDGVTIAASEINASATTGTSTQMMGVYFAQLVAGDTLTVNVAQNSGSSLTFSSVIRAVKIG